MSTQSAFNFDAPPPPAAHTMVDRVRNLLSNGEWWTSWELCNAILGATGVMISDAGASARVRDLRKQKFGGHIIVSRKRSGENIRSFEYRMER